MILPVTAVGTVFTILIVASLLATTGATPDTAKVNNNDPRANHTIFKDMGTMYQASAIMHVAFDLDLSQLRDRCTMLEAARKEKVSAAEKTKHREANNNHLLTDTCRMVKEMGATFSTDMERPKRQIIAGAIAALTGMTLFGLYEHTKIKNLAKDIRDEKTRTHDLIVRVQKQATLLHDISKRMEEQDYDMLTFLRESGKQKELADKQNWLQEYTNQLMEFAWLVQRLHQGITDLRHGQLASTLVPLEDANKAFEEVKKTAEESGGKPIITRGEGLYELPVSFMSHKEFVYQIIVHVPIIRQTFQLYRYRPMPIQVTDGTTDVTVIPDPEHRILAYNLAMHRELDQEDLHDCWHWGRHFVCNEVAAYHLRLTRTCLGALFAGDKSATKLLCPIKRTQESWNAEPLDQEHLIVYFRDETRVQVACVGEQQRSLTIKGSRVLRVRANCTILGDDLRVTTHRDALVRHPITVNPEWEVEDLLEDNTPTTIEAIKKRIEERHLRAEAGLRELREQGEWLRQAEQDTRAQRSECLILPLTTIGLVVFVIALACAARYLCVAVQGRQLPH